MNEAMEAKSHAHNEAVSNAKFETASFISFWSFSVLPNVTDPVFWYRGHLSDTIAAIGTATQTARIFNIISLAKEVEEEAEITD